MIANPSEQSWLAVEAHAKKEIERLRDRLEADGMQDVDAQFLRGQISALRAVIALNEQQSSSPVIPTVDYSRM